MTTSSPTTTAATEAATAPPSPGWEEETAAPDLELEPTSPPTSTNTTSEEEEEDEKEDGESAGVFLMLFWLVSEETTDTTQPGYGILNDTHILFFQAAMENTTILFAPPSDAPYVQTICQVTLQEKLVETAVIMTNYTNDTATTRGHMQQRHLQQQEQQSVMLVPLTQNNNATTAQGSLFQYMFQMTYKSTTTAHVVVVENIAEYPQLFATTMMAHEQLAALSLQLARMLDISPANRVQVTQIKEVQPVGETIVDDVLNMLQEDNTDIPTYAPTTSPAPSIRPSISEAPSISPQPSAMPSAIPTILPTAIPSSIPSFDPTFLHNSTAAENYNLEFSLVGSKESGFLNESEVYTFCQFMENQTQYFAPESIGQVDTICTWIRAISVGGGGAVPTGAGRQRRRLLQSQQQQQQYHHYNYYYFMQQLQPERSRRHLQTTPTTPTLLYYQYIYSFRMKYTSETINVTAPESDYTQDFRSYLADNGGVFTQKLTMLLGLSPQNNLTLMTISTYESASDQPSEAPSEMPSTRPTVYRSNDPTLLPSSMPTNVIPTAKPTNVPTRPPTIAPTVDTTTDNLMIIVVAVVVALIGSAILIGLVWFYKSRQKKIEFANTPSPAANNNNNNAASSRGGGAGGGGGDVRGAGGGGGGDPFYYNNVMEVEVPGDYHNAMMGQQYGGTGATTGPNYSGGINPHRLMLSAHSADSGESILSNPSLLSNGQGDDDDDDLDQDDDDDDDPLQRHSKLSPLDDFDRFKDQNLENLRSAVEANVRGMDGMMSQALTMALMDGGYAASLSDLWGGATSGIEVEANALCEVTDWMKRNDNATMDEKQRFMQSTLNKMVIAVRQGILSPDDASRTIHECAALLTLQLVNDLPVTTVILSGMRKTVKANDVIRAFRKFGPIEDAAVASNERGFGIVRFRNQKAVQQVRLKFKTAEIVVQDVAVQVKVLSSTD